MTKKRPVPPNTAPDYGVMRPAPASAPASRPAPLPATAPRAVPVLVDPPGLDESSNPQLDDELGELLPDLPGPSLPPPYALQRPAAAAAAAAATWQSYPKGPHNPRAALPWDAHSYPPAPAIPSPGRVEELRRKAWLWMRRRAWPKLKEMAWNAAERAFWSWLEDYLNGAPDAPTMPALPPGSPTLPALPPGRDLPALPPGEPVGDPAASGGQAMPSVDELAAIMRDPVGADAYSTAPLDLMDRWLKLAGIRHFSARELCKQKWKGPGHTYKGDPRGFRGEVIEGVACWSELLDALPPQLGNHRGLLDKLPRYVVPPVEVWPRILPALMILDRYRHMTGDRVTAISCYRCRAYNWQIGGAVDSRHMCFEAVDFVPAVDFVKLSSVDKNNKNSNRNVLDWRKFKAWFEHMYRGPRDGLGVYDDFMHIDINTRGADKAKAWDNRVYKWK